MTESMVLALATNSLNTALKLSLPILGVALLVGVIVSIIQAATQIQEMTLTFVPKLLAIMAVLMVAGPWMISTMVEFTRGLMVILPQLAK